MKRQNRPLPAGGPSDAQKAPSLHGKVGVRGKDTPFLFGIQDSGTGKGHRMREASSQTVWVRDKANLLEKGLCF
jgi:hypothetical protein